MVVAGPELKREFISGDLRDPGRAAVPVGAAIGGVVVPAVLFFVVNLGGDGDTSGWAIPTATDIAFALDDDLAWTDVVGLSILCWVGFTVSLLISELAFAAGSIRDDHVKVGVLAGSVLSDLLATVVLRLRNRVYRKVCEDEARDDDHDGVPDVYEPSGAAVCHRFGPAGRPQSVARRPAPSKTANS